MAENQGPVMINISRPPMIDNGRSVKSSTYTWSDLFIEEEISESSEDDSERTNDNDDNCFVDYDTCDETTTITTTTMPPPSPSSSPPPPPRRRRNRSTFYDSNDIKSNSSSNNNNAVEDDEDAMKCFTNTSSSLSSSTKQSQSQSQSQGGRGRRRSVRFEQYIEIRTYSIILGDHPWCEDGYSIELGNDVVSVDRIIDLNLNDDCCSQQRRPTSKLHRRSFIERKQLLIEVGGYTEQELEKYLGFCNHNTATNGGGGGLSRVKSVLTNIVNAAA